VSAEFAVDPGTGRIVPARHVRSPNFDERPGGAQPTLIVIHGISLPPGSFGGPEIEALFTNTLDWDAHPYFSTIRGLEVSAHLLVRRNGNLLQFVPFDKRAWHCGPSAFRGRSRCNEFSVGIELEGEDETPYDDRQYAVLTRVVAALRRAYPWKRIGQYRYALRNSRVPMCHSAGDLTRMCHRRARQDHNYPVVPAQMSQNAATHRHCVLRCVPDSM
jgi:AmpD protein